MHLTLLRNATLLLEYAGHRWLFDPDLAPRHARPSFTGREENPTVDLPADWREVVAGADAALVSHLHRDHWDHVTGVLPDGLPLLCQPGDAARLREQGFRDVRPVEGETKALGVRVQRVGGHHGQGAVEAQMGAVSGFVLSAPGEPSVYLCGDTLLCDEVRMALAQERPAVIVTHSGGARWGEARDLIIMDAAQTADVARLAPWAQVVAVHLEALDHCTVSRAELRRAVAGLKVRVPEDGETLSFTDS